MSTILKALRRLEDDKKVQDDRSLRERVLAGETTPQTGGGGTNYIRLLVLLGGFFLLAGAGVVGFFFWNEPASEPVVAEVSEPVPEPKKPPGLMALANPPRPVIRGGPVPQFVVPVPGAASAPPAEPVEAVVVTEDIAIVTRSETAASERPESKPVAKPAVKSAAKPVAVPAAKLAARPVAVPAAKPVAKPVTKSVAKPVAKLSPPKAPPMPKVERVPIPEFVVTRTVWHPNAARRVASVQLKGASAVQLVSEGDEFGTLKVVEIQPAAVLFRRDGVEIKRRIGH